MPSPRIAAPESARGARDGSLPEPGRRRSGQREVYFLSSIFNTGVEPAAFPERAPWEVRVPPNPFSASAKRLVRIR